MRGWGDNLSVALPLGCRGPVGLPFSDKGDHSLRTNGLRQGAFGSPSLPPLRVSGSGRCCRGDQRHYGTPSRRFGRGLIRLGPNPAAATGLGVTHSKYAENMREKAEPTQFRLLGTFSFISSQPPGSYSTTRRGCCELTGCSLEENRLADWGVASSPIKNQPKLLTGSSSQD